MQSRASRIGTALLLGALLWTASPAAWAAGADAIVVVGRAPLDRPDSRGAALTDAIRTAVARIGGETELGAHALDALMSQRGTALAGCESAITSWAITDTRSVGDRLELTVRFQLLPGTLREELLESSFDAIAPEVLYEWVGRPRVIIELKELLDGEPDDRRQAAGELEDALIERSIDIRSREETEALIARESRLSADRPAEAARLREQFRSELVLTGTLTGDFSRESPPIRVGSNEVTYQFYTSYLRVRLVESTTGRVLVSKQWNNSNPGDADLGRMGKTDAGLVSKQHLVKGHVDAVIGAIAQAWRKRVVDGQPIRVQVQNVGADRLGALDDALRALPRVADVRRRSFTEGGAASYELRYKGQQPALEDALTQLRAIPLRLVDSAQNSIIVASPETSAVTTTAPAAAETLEVVALDTDEKTLQRLIDWLESQSEVKKVERDPAKAGGLRAEVGKRMTSGELFRRMTAGAGQDFDTVALDRDGLQVRASGGS